MKTYAFVAVLFASSVLSFITRLWPRRLTVVDEQKGLVFSFPMFQHRSGKIHETEAMGVSLPYGTKSPWE